MVQAGPFRPPGPSDDSEHWLAQALALAHRAADAGGVPFAALVIAGGEVVGYGANRVRVDRRH